MKKLNQRKIRWICREMEKRGIGAYTIAKIQGISPRHARRVHAKYGGIKKPRLLPCGRRPSHISKEDMDLVMSIRKEHPLGAVNLEKILSSRGTPVPHNRIHTILMQQGFAKKDPKKSKRRKWVRYERRHTNSLWHTDWFELDGRNAIGFIDDASRLAPAVQVFDRATAENAVKAIDKAVGEWGTPRQLISDHGTSFTSLPRDTCAKPEPNAFQVRLKELGIQHIKARVKHPQTSGKMEKFVHTARVLSKHFGDLDKAIEYYNFRRPHMSLENGSIRTPYQAFIDKWRRNEKLPKTARGH